MKDAARILCGHCVYWSHLKTTTTVGHCRIKSPRAISDIGAWPVTDEAMWCGEGFDGVETFSSNLARMAAADNPRPDIAAMQRAFGEGGGRGGVYSGPPAGGLQDLVTIIYKKPDDWDARLSCDTGTPEEPCRGCPDCMGIKGPTI